MNEHNFKREYISDDSIPGLTTVICKIKCDKCNLERFTAIAQKSMGSADTLNSVEAQMNQSVSNIKCESIIIKGIIE